MTDLTPETAIVGHERHTAGDWLAILRGQFSAATWTLAIIEECVALDQVGAARARAEAIVASRTVEGR